MTDPGATIPILVGALAIDALVGDPDRIWRRWPHPVVWFGGLIGWGERRFNDPAASRRQGRLAGAVALAGLLGIAAGGGWVVETACRALPGGTWLVAVLASTLLAQRSLYEHVRRVADAFAEGGLEAARRAVAMIVGRDPDSLDSSGVARAAIESAAENLSDGVVAPAFWFALGGLPGLAAYKALNTADSMVGHLLPRFRHFGWAAARLDDGANLVPARLCGLLVALAAPCAGGGAGPALRAMWRDAGLHRSPNAGWPESAMAGALGVALGGPRLYAEGPVVEPFLNAAGRAAGPADIGRALRVMVGAAFLHAALYGVLAVIL